MFIENVSYDSFEKGFHIQPTENAVAIQILAPDSDYGEITPFPFSPYKYKSIHQFRINDSCKDEDGMTDEQAKEILTILQKALYEENNVIVHCAMGHSRSGAVAEIGELMGFNTTGRHRSPNIQMKSKMKSFLFGVL